MEGSLLMPARCWTKNVFFLLHIKVIHISQLSELSRGVCCVSCCLGTNSDAVILCLYRKVLCFLCYFFMSCLHGGKTSITERLLEKIFQSDICVGIPQTEQLFFIHMTLQIGIFLISFIERFSLHFKYVKRAVRAHLNTETGTASHDQSSCSYWLWRYTFLMCFNCYLQNLKCSAFAKKK